MSLSDLGGIGAPTFGKHNIKLSGFRQNQDRTESGTGTARITIYQDPKNTVTFNGNFTHTNIFPNDTGITDLYESNFGLSYSHIVGKDRAYSFFASYGTKTDKPYADSSVNTLNLNAAYSLSKNERGRWLFLLNYSNNRPFLNNIPLPFFAYTYIHSKDFVGTFGAPFASVFWRFHPKVSMTLFAVIPWILKAQVSYSILGPLQVYSGVDFSQQSYFQHGRSNNKERLFYEENKIFVGFKSPISKNIFFETEFGNSFNRQYFFAEDYSRNPKNPTRLTSSLFGRVSLNVIL